MENKLAEILKHYAHLKEKSISQEIVMDPEKYMIVAKELKQHEPVIAKNKEMQSVIGNIEAATEMLQDPECDEEMSEMATLEKKEGEESLLVLKQEMKTLLLPKDPLDDKNIIIELRAGAGGDEAALFVADLFRMYSRFSEKQGWKTEILTASDTGQGGYKELSMSVVGELVYSKLKFESGVHRVQRVPSTESAGRIHTSTITVAILPEIEEKEFSIDEKDVRTDTFCASGPGGQSVNTTYSAVRLTHIPTNTVVSCQDEKSQIKNKAKAFKVLRARLAEIDRLERAAEYASQRSSQIGTGDRSEKIRTYNYPQGRVSDHRINMTMHNLPDFIEGNIGNMVEGLIADDQKRKLEEMRRE
ncbi:MAG: peptide chain release factor 1 [Candidatus Cloacimonadota bacterium]|nr:MAG: peptide chain release factor 1 [Candidatus Cloacimonadota bacterium]